MTNGTKRPLDMLHRKEVYWVLLLVLMVSQIGLFAGSAEAAPASISAPTNLSASHVTDTTADLSWDTVTGATYYSLYNAANNNLIATSVTQNVYSLTGLTQGSNYSYYVTASNGSTESSPSSSVNVQTKSVKFLTFDYPDYSDANANGLLALNGYAQVVYDSTESQNVLRLTTPSGNEYGTAFNKHLIYPGNNFSFSTAFSFRMNGEGSVCSISTSG